MSKHIKLFNTTTQYEQAKNSFDLPNVSTCRDSLGTVHYHSWPDPYNGHDYVEIGGLKWATMNIGASSPTDAGLYFQWGDISGYTAAQVGTDKVFNWANYKYSDNGTTAMTKYNSTDGKTVLEASDDEARANWGGSWRMPITAEFQALGNAVNTAWTSDYQSTGVAGMICTAKDGSGAQLFFPAAGRCVGSSIGADGYYWSSSINGDNVTQAYSLNFVNGSVNWGIKSSRFAGFSVRGVVG